MAAFKVFAAILVVCVASTSAGILPQQWNKPDEDTTSVAADPFDLRFPNPFKCVGYFPETWSVLSELTAYWKQYQQIQDTIALMKAQCDAMMDEQSKEICLKNAEDIGSQQVNELLKKAQEMIPRIAKLVLNLKGCLFN